MILAGAPGPLGQVVFQGVVVGGHLLDLRQSGLGQGRAPQVGVNDHPGGVDHPAEHGLGRGQEGLLEVVEQGRLIQSGGQRLRGRGGDGPARRRQDPPHHRRGQGPGQGTDGRGQFRVAQQVVHLGQLPQQRSVLRVHNSLLCPEICHRVKGLSNERTPR